MCEYFEVLFLNPTLWKFNLPNYQSINRCHAEFLNTPYSYVWTFALVKIYPQISQNIKILQVWYRETEEQGGWGAICFCWRKKRLDADRVVERGTVPS